MRKEKRNRLLQELSQKEPFRVMANRMQHYKEEGKQCIAFVSHVKGQGKTYIIQEVARTLARSGHKVLLVDCNLFSERLTEVLGHSEHEGVIDALEQICANEANDLAMKYTQGIDENLYLMPKGGGMAEIVYEKLMKQEYFITMFNNLKPSFDYILVEVPSFEYFSYTQNILSAVDGGILVLKSGTLACTAAPALRKQLDVVGCDILSCILNEKEDTSCKVSKGKKGVKKEQKTKVESNNLLGEGVMM